MQATLQLILDGQEEMKTKLQSIETNQMAQSSALQALTERINCLETQVAAIAKVETEMQKYKASSENNQKSLKFLLSKVDDLENRGRRNNLVFYGVDDKNPQETWSDSEKIIQEVCETNLGLSVTSMERVHRIGKFKQGKNRPVIASFSSFKEKEKVMQNAKGFKNTGMSVSEDYSETLRRKRHHLWEFAKCKSESSDKVKLKHDVLLINGSKYIYDDAANQVVPLD